jgi:hypothetical protein
VVGANNQEAANDHQHHMHTSVPHVPTAPLDTLLEDEAVALRKPGSSAIRQYDKTCTASRFLILAAHRFVSLCQYSLVATDMGRTLSVLSHKRRKQQAAHDFWGRTPGQRGRLDAVARELRVSCYPGRHNNCNPNTHFAVHPTP